MSDQDLPVPEIITEKKAPQVSEDPGLEASSQMQTAQVTRSSNEVRMISVTVAVVFGVMGLLVLWLVGGNALLAKRVARQKQNVEIPMEAYAPDVPEGHVVFESKQAGFGFVYPSSLAVGEYAGNWWRVSEIGSDDTYEVIKLESEVVTGAELTEAAGNRLKTLCRADLFGGADCSEGLVNLEPVESAGGMVGFKGQTVVTEGGRNRLANVVVLGLPEQKGGVVFVVESSSIAGEMVEMALSAYPVGE